MRCSLATQAAAASPLAIVPVAGAPLGWNADLLRSSFVRFVSWQSGGPIDVRGALHLHR